MIIIVYENLLKDTQLLFGINLFFNFVLLGDESAIAFVALKYLGDLLPQSFDTKARCV